MLFLIAIDNMSFYGKKIKRFLVVRIIFAGCEKGGKKKGGDFL